jgi:hypothetical protein
MSKYSALLNTNLKGIHFSQSMMLSLNPREVIFGQKNMHKAIILLLSMGFSSLSGIVLGLTGSSIFSGTISYTSHGIIYFLIFIILGRVSQILCRHSDLLRSFSSTLILSWMILPLGVGVVLLITEKNLTENILPFILIYPIVSLLMVMLFLVGISTLSIGLLMSNLILQNSQNKIKKWILYLKMMTIGVAFLSIALFHSLDFLRIRESPSLTLHKWTQSPGIALALQLTGATIAAIIGCIIAPKLLPAIRATQSTFPFAKTIAWKLAIWGGTSFRNLDLSEMNFSDSKIANTDFRGTKLYRTSFQGAIGMDYALFDSRYLDLEQPKVQTLLTRGMSQTLDFQRTTLRGAYLQNATLDHLDFTEANLDGADLFGANLQNAIFVRTIVTNVNLSEADLTGCCIQDWSWNADTCFTGVKCHYFYQTREDQQADNRYPMDRFFEPGEFAALFQRLGGTIEWVVRDRLDPLALDLTLENFKLEDGGQGLTLEGLEARGDVWIVKVGGLSAANPRQVIEGMELRYQLMIDSQKDQIQWLREQVQHSAGNVTIGGDGNTFNLVHQAGTVMGNQNIKAGGDVSVSTDQSTKTEDRSTNTHVTVGGSVTGALNLGDLSQSTIAVTPTALAVSNPETPDLATLLKQLKEAIESESDLSAEDKEEALEALCTLTEEGQKPESDRHPKLATMSLKALSRIAQGLSEVGTLAESVNKVFPFIKLAFGLI